MNDYLAHFLSAMAMHRRYKQIKKQYDVETYDAIKVWYGFVDLLSRAVGYKTKSSWPAALPVIDDLSIKHPPLFTEQVL